MGAPGQLQLQGGITPSSSSLKCEDDLCKNDDGGHGGSCDRNVLDIGWITTHQGTELSSG